jgi:hypothetical protein
MTNKYALIDQDDKVGQIIMSASTEAAQELANTVFYGIKEVVEIVDQEGADKVALGCDWDGEKFIALPPTELDLENPTTLGIVEEATAE